ncbi:Cwf21 [Dictyocaulus viviparus]|uniref:Cwf21 n=1 Tax=Dictyocaulus viviparus TaxID=29172 RepID=A0A0D8Y7G2_DICVI|nr:Cwf21 [Dictyocaulus viviparus]
MYNGIGLQTARGTGTNGYVQANLSNLLLSKKRVEYNSEADLRRTEAELNRPANEEILQHQRKRVIEMKCAEFEMLMEEKGFDDDEISKKVSDYRTLLLNQLESGELDLDSELDTRDSHARAKAAVQNRDRMRDALGVSKDFVPGASMRALNKSDIVGAAFTSAPPVTGEATLISTLKREMKEKSETKKRKKRRHESTSSSSSDSSSTDSSESSSDESSSDSSNDSSSDESVRKTRTKVKDSKNSHHDKESNRKKKKSDRSSKEKRDEKYRKEKKGDSSVQRRSPHRSSNGLSKKKGRDSDVEERRTHSKTANSYLPQEDDLKKSTSRTRSPRPIKVEPNSSGDDDVEHVDAESKQKKQSARYDTNSSSHDSSDSYSDSNDSLKHKMRSTVSVVKR